MRVTVEDIPNQFNGDIHNTCKMIVIDEYIANSNQRSVAPIKILVSLRSRRGSESRMMAPSRSLHECHLAIGVDYLCNGQILKNRWGHETRFPLVFDTLVNQYLPNLLEECIVFDSNWDKWLIIQSIVTVISQITGEPIFSINGYFKTERCFYTKRDMIRYKKLTHSFIKQKKPLSLQNEI